MEGIATCPHCGTELTEDYGEYYMENPDVVIRQVYVNCNNCERTYTWEEVFSFQQIREVEENAH